MAFLLENSAVDISLSVIEHSPMDSSRFVGVMESLSESAMVRESFLAGEFGLEVKDGGFS